MTHVNRREFLASSVLAPPVLAAEGTRTDHKTVLHDLTLIDGRHDPESHRSVVVRGNRIEEVLDATSTKPPSGSRRIECRGLFLIPGLWDMHVHLSYTKASALPALLANGVTGVRDMGGRLAEIDQWRGELRAGTLEGPRIFRAGPMLNGRFADYQLLVTNADEARGAVRALQRAGVDLIKHHRMTPRDAYFGIAAEAKALGIPFAGHIPRTVSPEEASDAGQRTIEHVETLFEGTFSGARDDVALAEPIARFKKDGAAELFARFARNGNWFTPTLIAFQEGNRFWDPAPDPRDRYVSHSSKEMLAAIQKNPPPSSWMEDRIAQFPHHLELVGMAHRAGVGLLTGTDLAARIFPGFSLHDELDLLVKSGVPPLDALYAGTSNPPTALGQSELGTIERGKIADMVLLDANPIDDIRNVGRIRAVISNGHFFDRGRLDRLLATAERMAQTA
jgi:imidazolonepropionase-like amidohydrolase